MAVHPEEAHGTPIKKHWIRVKQQSVCNPFRIWSICQAQKGYLIISPRKFIVGATWFSKSKGSYKYFFLSLTAIVAL